MTRLSIIVLLMLNMLWIGCARFNSSERVVSNPSQALLGHWRMEDGAGDIFFSEDGTYRFIDADGTVGLAEYRVLSEDAGARTIICMIRLKEMGGRKIKEDVELMVEGGFSPDYRIHSGKSLLEGGEVAGTFKLEYVDETQAP